MTLVIDEYEYYAVAADTSLSHVAAIRSKRESTTYTSGMRDTER